MSRQRSKPRWLKTGAFMVEAWPDCKADSTGYGPATAAERVRRPRHVRLQIAAEPVAPMCLVRALAIRLDLAAD